MNLSITSLSYRYPGATEPALADISCEVGAGECVCFTGDSGCGKSTLLLAIKGALRGGSRVGSIEIPPHAGDGRIPVGIVFQNAESQIVCTTAGEEVAFAPENLCIPREEIAERVALALRAVGLEGCQKRNVDRFSAGQKQRLAIASVLSANPGILLLDEPSSQLDRRSKEELRDTLGWLKREGYIIVLAEHDILPFAGIIDRYFVMERGKIVSVLSMPPAPRAANRSFPARLEHGGAPVLTVRGLHLGYPETGAVLNGVDLTVGEGERVHLLGDNGAGKSTLFRALCGLARPDLGTVELAGIGKPVPERLAGKVGVLFQNPTRQLFAESVQEEVSFTLKREGRPLREIDGLVAEALAHCRIAHLAGRTPLTLSFGEQHRVALASVLAGRPRLLLLDEPFAGLDMAQRGELLEILGELPARFGTSVLIASHDRLPVPGWADRELILKDGRVTDARG
ncbi:energy-coupling factor ABC transporter ATP-binding protein [Geomonas sp. Red32]|uniref:ABC transporter ATP-binding protein n=1 Tax=Geomonas sp. Red32 TaxID=2912856 RepID=UPI00202CDC00|nr:ABC transporter ATP-binding protein [Geomonas sp. Red32]MCM0080446.1 energy-coupling factor ABC transporter ATP-binding protein [Geomonas sp. Red32]